MLLTWQEEPSERESSRALQAQAWNSDIPLPVLLIKPSLDSKGRAGCILYEKGCKESIHSTMEITDFQIRFQLLLVFHNTFINTSEL